MFTGGKFNSATFQAIRSVMAWNNRKAGEPLPCARPQPFDCSSDPTASQLGKSCRKDNAHPQAQCSQTFFAEFEVQVRTKVTCH